MSAAPLRRPLHILLDLSGTLHIGDTPTPGAVAALGRLRAWLAGGSQQQGGSSATPARGSLRFCSNTTKASPAKLRQTLLAAGFAPHDVPEAALYTSLSAAARALAQLRQPALLLLSPSAMEVVHDEPGTEHFRPSPKRLPAELDAQERRRLEACTAVVVGLAPELMRAEWLDEAFRVLSGEYARPGEPSVERRIIATHRGESERRSAATGPPLSSVQPTTSGQRPTRRSQWALGRSSRRSRRPRASTQSARRSAASPRPSSSRAVCARCAAPSRSRASATS
jgi:hypothetical protein